MCVCVFWVEPSFEEQPKSQYVEPEPEPEPEYEGGIHTHTHTLSAPVVCFSVVLSHLTVILSSSINQLIVSTTLWGMCAITGPNAKDFSHLVFFHVTDVQAVADNYEMPVEQKQPQYDTVVEQEAVYEDPAPVRHSQPELTSSE